jgi:hypothetical protein
MLHQNNFHCHINEKIKLTDLHYSMIFMNYNQVQHTTYKLSLILIQQIFFFFLENFVMKGYSYLIRKKILTESIKNNRSPFEK